jgi:zinc D-Ala-D-Ala dipeptidase
MHLNIRLRLFRCILMAFAFPVYADLPKGFVYLRQVDPTILQEIRYAGSNNFVGRPLPGYRASECILTNEAAHALARVQAEIKTRGLSLKVYDCYRPQRTVNEFVRWSRDLKDQKMKDRFYPNVDKRDFFRLGYVAEKSGHSRGSTVDLTLVKLFHSKIQSIDMGTTFDFMDPTSWPSSQAVSVRADKNRRYLQSIMKRYGFIPYAQEWWHFTLKNEPYPNQYFNFTIE